MNLKRYFTVVIFILALWSTRSQRNSVNLDSGIIEMDSLVRYGKLENGFSYYIRDNNSETTELRMVVNAGIFHEEMDQLEYAHLIEHMIFKYPRHFPHEEKYFRSSGRYVHARTGNQYTYYNAWMPSTDKEGLQNGLQLLRDWANDVYFDQKAIDVERGAILGEGRVYDPHYRWTNDTIEKLLLKNTNFNLPSRSNYIASIQNFNRESFLNYYEDWYRPDLQAAIIVGNINVDSVEVKIKKMFSDLKNPDNPKSSQEKIDQQTIDLPGNNQYNTILDTVKPNLRAHIIRKRMNHEVGPKSRGEVREMLLQQLYEKLIAPRSKRFMQQYNPPFSNFTTDYSASNIGDGQIYASMMTLNFKSDDQKRFKNHFRNALVTWKKIHTGLTNKELDIAKKQIKEHYSNYEFRSSSSLAQKYMEHFILGAAIPHPEDEKFMISELLEQIGLEEMQAFTLEYGDLSRNMDFIFFKGPKHILPPKKRIAEWVSEVKKLKVSPLSEPRVSINSLTSIVQKSLKKELAIIRRSENVIDVSTIDLKNGIKLILKPTKPRSENFSETISVRGFRPINCSNKSRKDYLLSKVAPEVIQFSGAGPYTKFELEQFKQDKGLKLKLKTNKELQILEGKTKVDNIQELLNLIYLYIDQPRMDEEAFAAWENEKKEVLNGNAPRGTSEFYLEEIRNLWYPGRPQLTKEDLDRITMTEVFDAFQKSFSDFNGFTFVVTGDFDKESIEQILVENLSGFPGGTKSASERSSKIDFPLKKMNKIIRMENIDQAFVRLYFPITVSDDIKSQVALRLLGLALHSKIWERLRAGCYSPSARGEWMDRNLSIYAFSIEFNSELGNENKMIQYALEEFRKLRENGMDQEWLDRAIEDEKARFSRTIDRFGYFNFWPDYLQEMSLNKEDQEEMILKYEAILEHFVTLKDVNKAAKLYLSEDNLQQFEILPENYKKMNKPIN